MWLLCFATFESQRLACDLVHKYHIVCGISKDAGNSSGPAVQLQPHWWIQGFFWGVEWPLPRSAWHCQHLQFLLQQLALAYMLCLISSKNIQPQRGCGAQRLMFITLCTRHPFAKKRRHVFMKTVASGHSWWWFIFTLGSQAANFNRADSKPFSLQSSPKFSPTQFENVLFFSSLVVIST